MIEKISNACRGWYGEIVCLLAGALLPFAFAPLEWFPLAVISVCAAFFVFLHTDTRKRLFWRAYLFGLSYFGIGISWVSVSMVRYGHMPMVLAAGLTLLLAAFLALYPALAAWLPARFAERQQRDKSKTNDKRASNQLPNLYVSPRGQVLMLLLILPALWVILEWMRGWVLTGFPWLNLGYSQTGNWVGATASLGGVYFVSLLIALTAGALILAVLQDGRVRHIALSIVVGINVLGIIALNIPWAHVHGKPLKASLIQANIAQEIKWLPQQRQPTIDLYTRLTEQNWDSDVIIWPETALPVWYHQAQGFLQGLGREARHRNTALLLGLPAMETIGGERVLYNAVASLEEDIGLYYKYHLVPFGEFIPFKSVLGDFLDLLQIPMSNFSSSERHQPVLDARGYKAAISICYEDAFGEELINGLPQAHYLVNVSNDSWFGDSLAPHQHLQIARMRTVETARPMLRATNNGVSAIIDHRGKVLATSPQFEQAVLSAEFQPMQGSTLYVRLGNWLVICLCLLMLLVAAYLWRKKPG